ncbi:MAG TPA: S8 family serine peptidase [Chitinophagales bacterium]|nr:S8 family serine peptidase [Chitinophagales bacterium]
MLDFKIKKTHFLNSDKMVPSLTFRELISRRLMIIPSACPELLKPIIPDVGTKLKFGWKSSKEIETSGIINQENLDVAKDYSIALIDTGVVKDHPALNVVDSLSCNGNPKDKYDKHGHGTHIAGILAARQWQYDDNYQIEGMAPGAPIVSFKVCSRGDSSTTWCLIADALARVLNYNEESHKTKISVVNLSFNGLDNLKWNSENGIDSVLSNILKLYEEHIPVVVSGGNYFDKFRKYGLAYPANYTKTIACGAACCDGYVQTRNHGSKRMEPNDLSPFTQRPAPKSGIKNFFTAPAIMTISTAIEPPGKYSVLSGSSMAAPIVTGIIFILQQWAKQNNKYGMKLPPIDNIRKALINGSDKPNNEGDSEFRNGVRRSAPFFIKEEKYNHINSANILREFKEITQ